MLIIDIKENEYYRPLI